MASTEPEFLLLGEILRPHGIRGELRMRMLTDYPERISAIGSVFVGRSPNDSAAKRYRVQAMRMHKNYGLLKLKTIADRNDAEVLRGLFVMVRLEDAVPLEDGEFYLYQLIGMSVVTHDNVLLGSVTDIIETGANDVYVVHGTRYGEVLVPVTDETILETDVAARRIIVRLPEGLLPG